jgi:hypothetical protein
VAAYDLVWEERRYPPKAILGTAYELAAGQRLASGDFEGGKSGAVRCSASWASPARPGRRRASRRAGFQPPPFWIADFNHF